jgi:hypothetical protein
MNIPLFVWYVVRLSMLEGKESAMLTLSTAKVRSSSFRIAPFCSAMDRAVAIFPRPMLMFTAKATRDLEASPYI